MLTIEIPDFATLRVEHLVLDYNGTLAVDGVLLEGVRERLMRLSDSLRLHVVTADTFGRAQAALRGIPCQLTILGPAWQSESKQTYVEVLPASATVCIGNGRNDRLMMKAAALAIAVVQREGASPETVAAAHVVVTGIRDALELLMEPRRLVATLRG